jgi:hypothetical protein
MSFLFRRKVLGESEGIQGQQTWPFGDQTAWRPGHILPVEINHENTVRSKRTAFIHVNIHWNSVYVFTSVEPRVRRQVSSIAAASLTV